MHHEVEPAEARLTPGGNLRNLLVARHVERQDQGVGQLLGQLLHVLAEPIALVGHRQASALRGDGFRDRPRDRTLVGDTDDQSGGAGELTHDCVS